MRFECGEHSFGERHCVCRLAIPRRARVRTRPCCKYERTCDAVGGLSSHAWHLCHIFCRPTLPFFLSKCVCISTRWKIHTSNFVRRKPGRSSWFSLGFGFTGRTMCTVFTPFSRRTRQVWQSSLPLVTQCEKFSRWNTVLRVLPLLLLLYHDYHQYHLLLLPLLL